MDVSRFASDTDAVHRDPDGPPAGEVLPSSPARHHVPGHRAGEDHPMTNGIVFPNDKLVIQSDSHFTLRRLSGTVKFSDVPFKIKQRYLTNV
jgi:hypothetical protein